MWFRDLPYAGMLAGLILLGLGSCAETIGTEPDTVAEVAQTDEQSPAIAPHDYLFAPCNLPVARTDCVLLAAGGKRVLIGAPAGIGGGRIAGDQIPPDGVILMSFDAQTIEGLDEVRNRAWISGRRRPLSVAGGVGIKRVITALNEAYITSDALAYVKGERRGGFDVEAMTAVEVLPGDFAFNTGDLTVTALAAGNDQLALWIDYEGIAVLLSDCGAQPKEVAAWPIADHYLGCEGTDYPVASQTSWPLTTRVYISR